MHTTYDLVWYAAERTPDHLAIVDDRTDRRLTYRQMIEEVDVIAAGLAERGIKAGCRFATVLPNYIEHCLIILALTRLGAVPALVNARLTAREVAQLVEDGAMDGAIILPNPDLARAVAAVLPKGGPLLSVGAMEGAEDFDSCRGNAAALSPFMPPAPDDPAYIFYTSGTTGLPKGVELSQRTTEGRITWISLMGGLRIGTHTRILGLAPISHCIGYYGNFLAALAYNGTYYIMSQFDPARAVDMIAEHKITFLFTVPTFFAGMVAVPNYDPAKMASLELILFGGASIPPALLERLDKEWPATFRHIFGTTETMCSLYNPTPVGQSTRLRAGFYSRIRVVKYGGGVDDIVAPGEEGELIIDANADTIFDGYLNRPDATAEKKRDGWYYAGDVFRLREDGDIELIGRVDDVIRSGGENIHPDDVEPILRSHDGVAEVSVVGIEDDYWGEMTVACVVAGDDGLTAADLDSHCKASTLSSYKRPRGYVFVDELPRNAANKVLRRVLKETAAKARADGDLQNIG
jgi:acyl-CoA synthetase (AMP-forming)/AMP-acid ligase II